MREVAEFIKARVGKGYQWRRDLFRNTYLLLKIVQGNITTFLEIESFLQDSSQEK